MEETRSQDDVSGCSSEAIAIMNLITLGESYDSVLSHLDELHLDYAIWKGGVELGAEQRLRNPSGPLEVLITANEKKAFGLFVGKKSRIILDVDHLDKVSMRRCVVVLTGP